MSGDICRIPIRRLLGAVAAACLTVATGGLLAAPATAASDVNWDAVAQCESGGNWTINTGNGFYGGLQFTLSTWRANGGVGNPAKASRDSQVTVAERVLVSQGIGAWPVCGKRSGNIVAATPRKPAKPATSVAPEPAPTTTGPTSAYTVLPRGHPLVDRPEPSRARRLAAARPSQPGRRRRPRPHPGRPIAADSAVAPPAEATGDERTCVKITHDRDRCCHLKLGASAGHDCEGGVDAQQPIRQQQLSAHRRASRSSCGR